MFLFTDKLGASTTYAKRGMQKELTGLSRSKARRIQTAKLDSASL